MIELLDIIGQDAAIERLERALNAQRMPHAFLFAGPAGVGRRTTALALARTLLCEQPTTAGNAGRFAALDADLPLRQACGACPSCRMAAGESHADLNLIYKELAAYHDDAQVRARKMQDLGIDVIRDFLIAPAGRSAARGRGKVFIVLEAELMSEPAQNALLKTLEEPPPGVTIILITDQPEQLLPTTLSRCSLVRFGPLPRDFVMGKLADANVPADEAAFWAGFAAGSLGRALRLHRQGMYDIKRAMVERIAQMPPAGDGGLSELLIDTMEKLAELGIREAKDAKGPELGKQLASRRAAGVMMELLGGLYRDAMHVGCGRDDRRLLVNADQVEAVRAVAGRFQVEQLAEVIEQLSRYEQLLWRNVNPKTVWDNVAITLSSAAPLHL